MSMRELCKEIVSGNRVLLSKAITLMESSLPSDVDRGFELMKTIRPFLPPVRKTYRIGVSGPPGAGKSTFLEHFGMFMLRSTDPTAKIAILALDPSSEVSGGALMGDKTRMNKLSLDPRCFIRPSPTRGYLGGVARSTYDSIRLCEAAGYDMIFIETVGVGQSETVVADMTDVFTVLIPPSGGDELQGLKKGIIEKADILIIHKADGDLLPAAKRTQAEYTSAFKLHRSTSKLHSDGHTQNSDSMHNSGQAWMPKVCAVSSLEDKGFDTLWKYLQEFKKNEISSNNWDIKREYQDKKWHLVQAQEEIFRAVKAISPELDKRWRNSYPDIPIDTVHPRRVAEYMLKLLHINK